MHTEYSDHSVIGQLTNLAVTKSTMQEIEKIIDPLLEDFGKGEILIKGQAPLGQPFYESVGHNSSLINKMPHIDRAIDHLLSPTPIAFSTVNGRITFGLSLIAKTKNPLINISHRNFTYQLTLSQYGTPQLNIYVFFDESNNRSGQLEFWDNTFYIEFPAGSIPHLTNPNTIEHIQAFIIENDPRTSRGTVTTVKPTSN
ncbi:hypothetical protein [uncultured Kordia sp.]|uniref:hypothetical protein n=1 Tax=uncultured Kordia sp. TaxID=507699 RepID=UPI00262D95D1|nr:hypothetical protein [uncultured Kordia sp.]